MTKKTGKLARKRAIFRDRIARIECHRQFLSAQKYVDQKGPSEVIAPLGHSVALDGKNIALKNFAVRLSKQLSTQELVHLWFSLSYFI